MKFQDARLSNSIIKILENNMSCIPLRESWKHALHLRTCANTYYKKFERNRKKKRYFSKMYY